MINLIKEEVIIEGENKIAGEINYLEDRNKSSVIIFLHGSGESDRNGKVVFANQELSNNFKKISDELVKAGYTTFRFDKNHLFDIKGIIADVRSVIKYIMGLENFDHIYIYAWSEGVRVIANLIDEFPNIDGLILQSGIISGWENYFSYILKDMGTKQLKELQDISTNNYITIYELKKLVKLKSLVSFFLSKLLVSGDGEQIGFNNKIKRSNAEKLYIDTEWISLANEISNEPEVMMNYVDGIFVEPWHGDENKLSNFKNNVLIIHGLLDGWVNSNESLRLHEILKENSELIIYKDLGHSLQKVTSPLKDMEGEISYEVIQDIKSWLLNLEEGEYER